ncbi:hypothetical protein A5756_18880 [Mycobacterium sp. 852002-53434_SCH5985345]|uniref:hypothetical protein n=1 Tax=unclassified Mycobacterium TaxID=2642494 RepID=UPI0007FEFCBB|nr:MULTISPECIES: hypothetical protein [unclassified Mycobacterium]OBF51878.1 hypothetical protein A5756_18880 [Mycobacterium sp. 852002-53434_SCH5985345]OBF74592.1 hypothetical protein A5750_13010 [Mycobacterium sp. 852002-51613_SCH5001154]OBG01080.1 hypothetical protein A5773_03355 [Mycobacterium sp. 852014-52450_SCH5900713]
MFTLLVSWLLVACVPALLMLAALGLGRLERGLAREDVTMLAVTELFEYAELVDVRTLAREGMPEAVEFLHRREARELSEAALAGLTAGPRHAAPSFAASFIDPAELTLPTRIQAHSQINPQFKATRHVNRV